MSNDKMREEFEAWAEKHHSALGNWFKREGGMFERDLGGEYVVRWLQRDFEAWQASREALVIELHGPFEHAGPEAWGEYEAAKSSIEAAGVKVKP